MVKYRFHKLSDIFNIYIYGFAYMNKLGSRSTVSTFKVNEVCWK